MMSATQTNSWSELLSSKTEASRLLGADEASAPKRPFVEARRPCEQSCTESPPMLCHCLVVGNWRTQPRARQGELMEWYRPSLRRRLASAWQSLRTLLASLRP